jgi:hypothetical protein
MTNFQRAAVQANLGLMLDAAQELRRLAPYSYVPVVLDALGEVDASADSYDLRGITAAMTDVIEQIED